MKVQKRKRNKASGRRRALIWGVGDVFTVPLDDGQFAVGQVIESHVSVLNSAICAFSVARISSRQEAATVQFRQDDLLSVVFTTAELLDSGKWEIELSKAVEVPEEMRPHPPRTQGEYVGVKIYGAGIVTHFLNAYWGLRPWDKYLDPTYLDKMLISPALKPSRPLLKSDLILES